MAKSRKKASRPWVAAAVLCENVLEEKDGVLTAVRIIDTFTITASPGWDRKTPIRIAISGLLSFRSGEVEGERTIRVFGTSPKKERTKFYDLRATFLGGNTGVNIKLEFLMGFKHEGTHWLDVYVDKWHATRIPITVVFREDSSSSGAAG